MSVKIRLDVHDLLFADFLQVFESFVDERV